MSRALMHQRVPGNHAPATGQEDRRKGLGRMAQGKGQEPFTGMWLSGLLGPDGRLAPHGSGDHEIIVGSGGESFTQGGYPYREEECGNRSLTWSGVPQDFMGGE